MLTAILFDLDGTLVDTDPLHYETWRLVLQTYALEIDRSFYQARISGRLNPVIVRDILPQLSPEAGQQLADLKEARFREIGIALMPLAGLLDLLSWIDSHSLKKAVVTNAPRENTDFLLKVLELSDRFDSIVLAEEAIGSPPAKLIAGKPDPASYKLVLEQLGISASEAIAFEDSPSGIKAAVGAGIYTIGVASTHEANVLLEAGAAMVIGDFTATELWDKLNSLVDFV